MPMDIKMCASEILNKLESKGFKIGEAPQTKIFVEEIVKGVLEEVMKGVVSTAVVGTCSVGPVVGSGTGSLK